jgi:hypothetical protein
MDSGMFPASFLAGSLLRFQGVARSRRLKPAVLPRTAPKQRKFSANLACSRAGRLLQARNCAGASRSVPTEWVPAEDNACATSHRRPCVGQVRVSGSDGRWRVRICAKGLGRRRSPLPSGWISDVGRGMAARVKLRYISPFWAVRRVAEICVIPGGARWPAVLVPVELSTPSGFDSDDGIEPASLRWGWRRCPASERRVWKTLKRTRRRPTTRRID